MEDGGSDLLDAVAYGDVIKRVIGDREVICERHAGIFFVLVVIIGASVSVQEKLRYAQHATRVSAGGKYDIVDVLARLSACDDLGILVADIYGFVIVGFGSALIIHVLKCFVSVYLCRGAILQGVRGAKSAQACM